MPSIRVEPFTVGNYIHVYNRGNRKQEIVRKPKDWWHFLEILFYLNDEYVPHMPFETLKRLGVLNDTEGVKPLQAFTWPEEWPKRKPLVKILAFALMENHYHLLLKEIKEGGVSKFMQRLGNGMTNYFNTKYEEVGTLFQGSYKARLIIEEMYLKDLSVYIQVKNPFERYPGGLRKAIHEFDKAYEFAVTDPYNSLADYAGKRNSPIIDKDILGKLFKTPKEYREFARDAMLARDLDEGLGNLIFEE